MVSTVYIAKNVYGGDGLGRLGDGRVAFVPGAWAGENVKAEIVEEKRHFVKARLVEIVDASPDRADAGELGAIPGCVYAALSPAGEMRAKESQLKDFLERARIPVPVVSPAEPAPLNYRNKAVYHFARQDGRWAIGYRAEPSHRIVDIERDPLAVPAINSALPEIRRNVLTLLTTGPVAVRRDIERKGNVTVRWTERTGVKWWIGDAPKDLVLKEVTAGRVFEVPADGFYQVNPEVGEALVKAVAAEYRRGLDEAANIVDLYCGVGVFGLSLLGSLAAEEAKARSPRLVGIESGRQAIDFARRNAANQGHGEAKFFAEQVGRNLRQIRIGAHSTVVVDPPRGGMEPNVPAWLAASPAPRILYVSCDPATLMRDLKELRRTYEVESVRWFNMFPRTARFETFVTLRKRRG